jgi:hypothetical protein
MNPQTEKEVIREEVNLYANFRRHLTIYIIIIFIIWVVWLLMGATLPVWPLYPTLGWGFIVGIHFIISYLEIRKMNKIK